MDQRLLFLVLVPGILLLTSLADASSTSTLGRQQVQATRVLGRRGRELKGEGLLGHPYRHEADHKQQQHEEVAMETTTTRTAATSTAGWADEDEGEREEGLIESADYSGVAMHSPSPPKRKHPKKP
ncbi:uncharacterized protein LOC107304128 [Oryza brachyantha]|uniref:Uncharacterized protein n=1 Tax=Oryza brachyantha TaxID=4533 RepID=J3M290_ORYBR|nr:uncharacterized protein LOC107304128 [Oryza brachyantha]